MEDNYFPPSGGIQEHKNSWEGQTKQTRSITKQDFSEKALLKQNIEAWPASLAFMWLVLGTDWVFHHICFQYMHMRRKQMVLQLSGRKVHVCGMFFV